MGSKGSKPVETKGTSRQPINKQALSAKIVTKGPTPPEGAKPVVSKKEATKVLNQQEVVVQDLIDKLNLQMRKDDLAARRFLALQKQDYARLGLKKMMYHDSLKNKLRERLLKTTDLQEQLKTEKLKDSLRKNIDKTEELCEIVAKELEADYIANARRPQFDLRSVNAELDGKGFTDDSVVDLMNNMWMQDLQSCLVDSEILEQWKDTAFGETPTIQEGDESRA